MFSLKVFRVVRTVVNNQTNFNYSRVQHLRRVVRGFEALTSLDDTPTIQRKFDQSEKELPFGDPFQLEPDLPLFENHQLEPRNDTRQLHRIAPRKSTLPSALDPVDPENPPDLVPNFPPTFNLAAYVNKSESLQQLIKLGVDLSRIEKRKGLPQFILKLNFERDMKGHITFLTDMGFPANKLGEFITKNPLIFKEELADLEVRVNYLEVKKFDKSQIARIVERNPFWLMLSTKRIDRRLGHFQKNFELTGNDVRYLATKQPRLITYSMEHIRKSTFCIREEMGFEKDDMKKLLLSKPRIWMMDSDELIERFDFIHRTMNISHRQILQFPEILTSRLFRLKERHGFLKYLGRAQYDSSKELYVSLRHLVEGTDKEFVIGIAKSSMEEYNTYLRSL